MNKEQTILHYMKTLELSREEAEQLWRDDHDDNIREGEELDKKAKQTSHREKSDKVRKNTPKERKVNETKKELIEIVTKVLQSKVLNMKITTETVIDFEYQNRSFTFKLTEHRIKK